MNYVQEPVTSAHYWQHTEIKKLIIGLKSYLSLVKGILGGKQTTIELRESHCYTSISNVQTWIE